MNFSRKKGSNFILNACPFILALVVFCFIEYASSRPELIENYYSSGIYPFIATLVSGFSDLFAFSFWDYFWTAFVLFIFFSVVMLLRRKYKFLKSLLRIFQLAALLYVYFYFVWGFNYFRQPLEKRLNWKAHIEKKDYFPAALDTLISNANTSRVSISTNDYKAIDSLIEISIKKNAAYFGYSYPNGSRKAKTMVYSSFFAKSGVSGYYGPFFGEVHVNGKLLPTEYPFVLAHEKCHQLGISGEAEANFMSWYICNSSGDNRLKYSSSIALIQYFLADPFHRDQIKEFLKRFDKRAMADIMAQRNHWKEMRNETLDKAQTTANNAYLKSNKIHEGVMNYNSVVRLMIEWYLNTQLEAGKSNP